MLCRGPTRLELRGEGADQLEQEYQEAKARRDAEKQNQRPPASANQPLQSSQQPVQRTTLLPSPLVGSSSAIPASAVTSPQLNDSVSSFFSASTPPPARTLHQRIGLEH